MILAISVNGEPRGDYFVVRNKDGEIFIKVKDLQALGLRADTDKNTVQYERDLYISCRNIPDIVCTFDPKTLSLSMHSPGLPDVLPRARTNIDFSTRRKDLYTPRENSIFLNYGFTYAYEDPTGFQSFEMDNKLGARTGNLFITSDSLYRRTSSDSSFVRLMTSATYERPDDLQWVSFGDTFASSGDLGSTINIGGLSIAKMYSMDPYFIRQPLLGFAGSVATPSQVDIYSDGTLVRSLSVRPGDFEVRNLYPQLGAGSVDVYIKDAYGNVQKVDYPVYGDTVLLRKGLHDYSYNLGFLRENYGTASNQYGKAAFSGYHRYGVTDAFDIKVRAEATQGLYNGGFEALSVFPRLGIIKTEVAESVKESRKGFAGSVQHTYQKGFFNTNLFFSRYSENYLTIASQSAGQVLKRSAGFLAGFGSPSAGTFSLGYSKDDSFTGASSSTVSSGYTKMLLKNLQMNLTARMTKMTDTDYSVFANLTYYFFAPHSNPTRVAAQYEKTKNTESEGLQVLKDPPARGEGDGYRLLADRTRSESSTISSFNPYGQYNGRYGIYSVGSLIQDVDGKTSGSYTVSASGSIVYVGGTYGFSRPVTDSFGIVTTDGIPGVGIDWNNEKIGTTDSSGKLVVPFNSYSTNRVTVDAKNLPLDYSITSDKWDILPSPWSGACVSFDASRVKAVAGSIFVKNKDKKAPLEYYEVTLNAAGKEITFQTGEDGQFYIENTLPRDAAGGRDRSCRSFAEQKAAGKRIIKPGSYTASFDYYGKKCEFPVVFPDSDALLTDLGEITCTVPMIEAKRNQPVAAPAAAPSPVKAVSVPQIPSPEVPLILHLELGRNGKPSKKESRLLSRVVLMLKKNPALALEIEMTGEENGPAGKRLAAKQAEAIRRILIGSGLSAGRIRTVEASARNAICDQSGADCSANNRGVVIRIAQSPDPQPGH